MLIFSFVALRVKSIRMYVNILWTETTAHYGGSNQYLEYMLNISERKQALEREGKQFGKYTGWSYFMKVKTEVAGLL